MTQPDDLLDELSMSKLRWGCRRGLLENDLFIERFFKTYGAAMTVSQAQAMNALMDLSDNDLLDLLLVRKEPEGDLTEVNVVDLLKLIRSKPHKH